MSTDITGFAADCEHVLQQLPMLDMTVKYGCASCGGVRDITAEALTGRSLEVVETETLADLGGTVGPPIAIELPSDDDEDERTEPRQSEYPTGGVPYEAITLHHLHNTEDIACIDFLDGWIDKGIADGTLTIAKAARYREAIAARCAELGEVPSVRQHLLHLQLKPGDILGVVAPADNQALMQQINTSVTRFLDYAGIEGVKVVVFPPGTQLHVLTPSDNAVRLWADEKVRAGVMSQALHTEILKDLGLAVRR